MDIREKFRADMALATEGAITEGAITEKVVRRRKPTVVKPDAELQQDTDSQLVDEIPVEPVPQQLAGPIAGPTAGPIAGPTAGPRTIRRRPQVAVPGSIATGYVELGLGELITLLPLPDGGDIIGLD